MNHTFLIDGVKHIKTGANGKEFTELVIRETDAFIYTIAYKYNKKTGREIGELLSNTRWIVPSLDLTTEFTINKEDYSRMMNALGLTLSTEYNSSEPDNQSERYIGLRNFINEMGEKYGY